MAKRKDVSKEFKKLQEKSKELDRRRDKFNKDLKGFRNMVKGRKVSREHETKPKNRNKK